jgi:enamine deaminase RidA (YjgF/YER057c/UK114 family)
MRRSQSRLSSLPDLIRQSMLRRKAHAIDFSRFSWGPDAGTAPAGIRHRAAASAAPAVGDYAPTAIAGTLLMTSGQLPWIAGELKFKGKIGADLSPEQGFQAFRLSALNAIAQLKASLGSLDRVKQVVRLEGTRGCAPGFTAQPSVLNGASHVVNQIFGPRGRHTRMIYSNNEMPMNCATLVVLYAEIVPDQ